MSYWEATMPEIIAGVGNNNCTFHSDQSILWTAVLWLSCTLHTLKHIPLSPSSLLRQAYKHALIQSSNFMLHYCNKHCRVDVPLYIYPHFWYLMLWFSLHIVQNSRFSAYVFGSHLCIDVIMMAAGKRQERHRGGERVKKNHQPTNKTLWVSRVKNRTYMSIYVLTQNN